MASRIARYVGGPLDGMTDDLAAHALDDPSVLTSEQLERIAERPPGWISTDVGVYVLQGPSPADAAWEYGIVDLPDLVDQPR